MEPLTRIPKERIAVLIGKGGATRKMIEDAAMEKAEEDRLSSIEAQNGPVGPDCR